VSTNIHGHAQVHTDAQPTAPQEDLDPPRKRPRRVLIAAADQQRRAHVAGALREAGFEVTIARTGREAVARALLAFPDWPSELFTEGEFIDCILIDPQMPDLAGGEVVRHLRQHGCDRPILAMVDSVGADEASRCRQLGFDRPLLATARPQDLVASVREYLW